MAARLLLTVWLVFLVGRTAEGSSATRCEHETMSISCPAGQTINIVSALYGRITREVCHNDAIYTTDCRSPNSLDQVKASCQGKSSCSVAASNSVFGDPCVRTQKYLEVEYTCTGYQKVAISCPAGQTINMVTTEELCHHGPTSSNSVEVGYTCEEMSTEAPARRGLEDHEVDSNKERLAEEARELLELLREKQDENALRRREFGGHDVVRESKPTEEYGNDDADFTK